MNLAQFSVEKVIPQNAMQYFFIVNIIPSAQTCTFSLFFCLFLFSLYFFPQLYSAAGKQVVSQFGISEELSNLI